MYKVPSGPTVRPEPPPIIPDSEPPIIPPSELPTPAPNPPRIPPIWATPATVRASSKTIRRAPELPIADLFITSIPPKSVPVERSYPGAKGDRPPNFPSNDIQQSTPESVRDYLSLQQVR